MARVTEVSVAGQKWVISIMRNLMSGGITLPTCPAGDGDFRNSMVEYFQVGGCTCAHTGCNCFSNVLVWTRKR